MPCIIFKLQTNIHLVSKQTLLWTVLIVQVAVPFPVLGSKSIYKSSHFRIIIHIGKGVWTLVFKTILFIFCLNDLYVNVTPEERKGLTVESIVNASNL